ncbi:MAG: response regulator transcription factor [Lachnospiraceae bacterium]|nr:response regulator transcription factor [Lachnospiraceae bacterium]
MLKIAICDDNVSYATGLKNQIRSLIPGKERVKFREYSRGNDFLYDLSEKKEPDVLFLDVQMPDLDGYNIAKKMREQTESLLLVFCSGVAEPTPELFKVDAYRYLLKQYNPQRMRRELREIIDCAVRKKEECHLWGYQRHSYYKIMLEHILYVSIAKRGSIIHLIDYAYDGESIKELNCKLRLTEIYERIKSAGFEYAHNSYIVNMKYVLRRNSTEIELPDKIVLSVSRSKAKTFEKSLCDYCSEIY